MLSADILETIFSAMKHEFLLKDGVDAIISLLGNLIFSYWKIELKETQEVQQLAIDFIISSVLNLVEHHLNSSFTYIFWY